VFYTNFTVDKINFVFAKEHRPTIRRTRKTVTSRSRLQQKEIDNDNVHIQDNVQDKLLIARTLPLSAVAAPKMFPPATFSHP